MKHFFLSLLFVIPSLAQGEEREVKKIRIKDTKAWLKQNGPETTCVDEYLQRRKQLINRMAWSPLTLSAGATAGALFGGVAGQAAYATTNIQDGWAELGYTLGGAALGTMVGAGITLTATTISTINFFNNQRIVKAIVEGHTENGNDLSVLHVKYHDKYPTDQLTIQEFSSQLQELDLTGKLCDGSIVAPERRKKGRKLKQNLATKTEIFSYIHERTGQSRMP